MSAHERFFEKPLEIGRISEAIPVMAKPGIPVEVPRRREVPDVPNPLAPERLEPAPAPIPLQPARAPRVPVPAGR